MHEAIFPPDIPSISAAWDQKKLVIVAKIGEGPQAGQEVLCLTERDQFVADLPKVKKHVRSRPFMRSLRRALRSEITKGLEGLSPETDHDFMGDLMLMMQAKIVRGDEVLRESGLFDILLAVNPDTSRPWDQRGILRVEDVTAPMIEQG